ncbi:hypothetical protein [Epilithonimonas xixisoli]|uniref:Uncharacterized protein n=1 Tax=Epilithonimonas xixisoli TaxID=1476462 RepID=A0A4R8I909_9FLAO|nr:hypothetical protein [Epilithonimonas xixisoli]TDX86548.1 hypothetical protein B0I22_0682 [Epilithonimonas xixisoli]
MKKYLMLIMFASTFLFGQQNSDKRYKEIAGRYGGNDGICLFEDGKYMLYGYATAIFGTYTFEKDYINFYPDQQELFMIFGSQNPTIGNSTRLYFSGFERDESFVQFDNQKAQPVFNDDANCFASPYVYETKAKPTQIILSGLIDGTLHQSKFAIPKEYNDLAIVHNKPSRYEENFTGMVKSEGKSKILNISMYDRYFTKSNEDKNDNNWKEILAMKSEYDQAKQDSKNGIFFNKHYHNFPAPESSAYSLDKKSNQYISKNAKDNEAYFRNDEYNDNRYLRKYMKVEGQTNIDKSFNKNNLSSKSLFFTTCGEGSEKSYKYNGFTEYEDQNEPKKLQQTTTVPPPPVN